MCYGIKKIAKSLGSIGAVDNASYKRGGISRVRLISAKANMKHWRPLALFLAFGVFGKSSLANLTALLGA